MAGVSVLRRGCYIRFEQACCKRILAKWLSLCQRQKQPSLCAVSRSHPVKAAIRAASLRCSRSTRPSSAICRWSSCAELRRAVSLIRRAQRADDNNAVRMYREAREWLAGIRTRRASKPESALTLGAVLKGAAHV